MCNEMGRLIATRGSPLKRRAVFLDRDGTLNRAIVRNRKPYPPASLDELEILPGVQESLVSLHRAGYLCIVVTNQPDIAAGLQSRDVVDAIHAYMQACLAIDDIRICFEPESERNNHYKPKPGMLIDAANEHGIELSTSYMVGDRWRDVGAGRAAGCYTYFIDYGYAENLPYAPDTIVRSLEEACTDILSTNPAQTSVEQVL